MERKFIIALSPEHDPQKHAQLYLEGQQPNALGISSTQDFYPKFMGFMDELKNLKYLDHCLFMTDHLTEGDRQRLDLYVREARRAVRDLKEMFGSGDDSLYGLKNILANIPAILKYSSSDRIEVRPSDFNAVVVSAGPSLDLEYENLKKLKGRALIICVDAVLRSLLDQGIEPDIVCCTERGEETLPFFENLPANLKTILVAQATVSSKVFDLYPGPKAISFKMTSHFQWLRLNRQLHPLGGSVAHLCYQMGVSLGAKSMALVGQDLAYHPTTFQTHGQVMAYPEWSEGDTFENRKADAQAFLVPGNTYAQVPSNPAWNIFAEEFHRLIAQSGVSTTNTSQLGRKLKGAAFQSLKDWAAGLKSQDEIQISVPMQNETQAQDREILRSRISDSITYLTELYHQLETSQDVNASYQRFTQDLMALELLLEILIREYISSENQIFANPSTQTETKQAFLNRAKARINEVLGLLRSAMS